GRVNECAEELEGLIAHSAPLPTLLPSDGEREKKSSLIASLWFLEDGEELFHGGGGGFVFFLDGGEGGGEVSIIETDLNEGLLGDFLDDSALGDDGNAGVDFDGAFDGFDVVELHDVLYFDVVFFENLVEGFARGNIGLEPDEFLAGKRFKFD